MVSQKDGMNGRLKSEEIWDNGKIESVNVETKWRKMPDYKN